MTFDFPAKVIDQVLDQLDTFQGQISFDAELVNIRDRKIEITVFIASTTHKARRKLFQVVTKRKEYPAEVFCQSIKSGYRVCDSDRILKSCLLTQCKSQFAKNMMAEVLEVKEVATIFRETK